MDSEAKIIFGLLMFVIGVFPISLAHLNRDKMLLPFIWLLFWWAIPVFLLFKYMLS